MIEAHYCWSFDDSRDKAYCHSLTLEKPFDVHSVTAQRIAEMIGQTFSRKNAKSVKYALI